jgi:hypothetical protein
VLTENGDGAMKPSMIITGGTSESARALMFIRRAIAGILLVTVILTTGCTSMRTIDPATVPGPAASHPLNVGDTVIVETRDRSRWRFVVQEVTEDAIIARGGRRFERADILRVQRKSFSTAKTVTLAGVVCLGVFVLYGLAVVSAYDDILSGR